MSKKQQPAAAPTDADALADLRDDPLMDAVGDALPPEDLEVRALVEVRALIDNAPHGLVSGKLALIAPELLASLKAAGVIDDHPEAVACAKAQA